MGKIYEKFKAETRPKPYGSEWVVVTDDEVEIVIATIPGYLKNQGSIARALAEVMTKSKYALTDLL